MKLIIVLTKEVESLEEAEQRCEQLKAVIPPELQVTMSAKTNTNIEPPE